MLRFLLKLLALLSFAPDLAANERIVVAAFEYPPIYQDGKNKGLSGDIVVESFKAVNIDAEVEFFPVSRMVLMVSKGLFVCGIGGKILFNDPEVLPTVTFSSVIQYVYQTFLYDQRRFPRGVDFSSLEEMRKYNIGVLRGSGIMRFLERTPGLTLHANNHHEGSARQLQSRRIDLWAIVDLTGLMYMQQLFPDEALHYRYSKALNLGDVSVVFSKKRDPENKYNNKFRQGLAIIKKNGTYMEIMARYYGGRENINKLSLTEDLRGKR